MATSTFGSTAATSLTGLQHMHNLAPVDVATIASSIKDDQNPTHPVWPGAYSNNGLLFIPNRGVLKLRAGDWIAVDSQGWPILVSANSVANSTWVHNP